jgi:class 3 adenylate cyclase/tetratricopeptide (TPR) repeat protein
LNCSRCQHENEPRGKYCSECGTPLAPACPGCGAALPCGAARCPSCGRPVAGGKLRFEPPGAYTPAHIADKVRLSKDALEGERKRITVLFADLEGSIELVTGRDPEEARAVLDGVLKRMMEAVHLYEGLVNQILGDGIMALFGAPVAHEDHALRACYAALRMQDMVRRYADEVPHAHVKIRVGMNSGEVLVRAIAGDLHMDYTAIGETTHLAARMEQMAQPGSILATQHVMQLVEGYVHAHSTGPRQVRKVPEPMELYEVIGAGAVRTRAQLAVHRGLVPFVGRQQEMAQLERARELAHAGQGQVVQITGEPGVGKSRLLWEFIGRHRERGWSVLESSSLSHARTTPYFPIVELLSRHFGIDPGNDAQAIAERIRGSLPEQAGSQSAQPALLALFEANTGERQWESLDPAQRHLRIVEAVKSVLLQSRREGPTILTVEDLHFIDAESQDVLDSIVKALPGSRTLLLVEHRPEYGAGWSDISYCTRIRVKPLSEAESRQLFRALAGPDASLDRLERRLVARTEGNALFLEESLRALAQSGALQGEPGRYRLIRSLDTIEIPAMVQDVLAARLDLLPAEQKTLLQIAAVVGRDVPLNVLAPVANMPDAELSFAVASLEAAEFLSQTNLYPELVYSFRHSFMQEVAYASLSHHRRRRLHGEILEVMEVLYAARLAERVELLALHAVQGEQWERAIGYLAKAAQRAYERSAYRDAVRQLEQAIRAAGQLPAGRKSSELAIDLRLELRNPLVALGAIDRILASLREALPIADSLHDDVRRARIDAHLTGYHWLIGHHQDAVKVGEQVLAMPVTRADASLRIPARFYLGAAWHSMGCYRQAIELLERNVTELEGQPIDERFGLAGSPIVFSRAWSAWSRAELGDFAAAAADAAEAVRIARSIGQSFGILAADFATAMVHMARDEVASAIQVLEAAVSFGRAERVPLWVPPLACQLGLALARAGRAPEAVSLVEQALPAPSDAAAFTPFASAVLGEVYLAAGRVEDALAQAERAVTRARRNKEGGYEAWALWLLGEIAATRDAASVEKHYGEALARAGALGMRPLMARCHYALGQADAALALFSDTGMRTGFGRRAKPY